MKMKITTLLLIIAITFTSCNAQVKPLGDEPLNLITFNFDTKITELYPEKNKSKDYKNVYEIKGTYKSQMVQKDTTFEKEYSANKKAIGFEYRQISSSSIDTIALLDNQPFQKINVATTINEKIKVINAVADELTLQQTSDLLKKLLNKYGKPKKFKNSWNEKLITYEWIAKDRIVRFVSAFDNESTTIKLVIDQNKKSIKSGKKEPHYVGYLFIIKPDLKNEVFGKMKTGDFVFLDDNTD